MSVQKIKVFLDLLRVHFFFVWPTLFCAGLFLGFWFNGGFSLVLVVQAILIGFLGFEGGLVLNDIVDTDVDKKELPSDNKLTKYWRPFGKRPITETLVSRRQALVFFVALVVATSAIIFTLPIPNAIYVFALMAICYCLEVFYQLKKRNEKSPIAQIVGRIDFALFLVAGYLCVGAPDVNAVLLFLFFYPLALAHLGVNDLIDFSNDQAKAMKTISTLYGLKATTSWIAAFSVWHFIMAIIFLYKIGSLVPVVGFAVSLSLIAVANARILNEKTPQATLKVLPMFHVAMLIYAITIITSYSISTFL